MRGSRDFDDLDAYRRFIDEIIGRVNARNAKRIDAERAALKTLPVRRTTDYEEVPVRVTSSGGFILRRVFYSVPSRLIGFSLRTRLYDDRVEVYNGGTHLLTSPRGRASAKGERGHVVDYRHVIQSLRKKPMALMGLVYRDQIFPRDVYRRMFDFMLETTSEREACRAAVELLAMAHERCCEAEIAGILEADLEQKVIPDIAAMRALFAPNPESVPQVEVRLSPLSIYECLMPAAAMSTMTEEVRA